MNIAKLIRALPREAGNAFLRTPLEVLLGISAWVGLAVAIELSTVETAWIHLAIAVGIALPIVYASSVLYATDTISRWTRWLIAGVTVTAAALYAFHRFDPTLVSESWRAALLIIMAILALFATPLLVRARPEPFTEPQSSGPDPDNTQAQMQGARQSIPDRRAHTHLFATRLATRVIIIGLYAAILYGGLAAAIAAIDGLFELDLPGEVYGHTAALVFVLMPPWAVAAGLPDLIAPAAPWSALTLRALRRIGLFLLAPLITIYLLIVYAYTVRMFITGEVPSNLVSPVVLVAGALTLVATILLEPLHASDDARGLSRFLRLLPALLLPLTALALWAVLIRVEQYGWTEFRYLRVLAILLLGAFAAAGTWRLFRGERPPLTWLPAVATVVLLLASVGPLGAPAVSLRSQEARLAALIPPTSERSAAQPVTLETDTLEEVTNRAAYLRDHFGWSALEPYLPPGATTPADRSRANLATTLGLAEEVDDDLPRVIRAVLPSDTGIPGIQGGTLYLVDYQRLSPPQGPVRTLPAPQYPRTAPAKSIVVQLQTTLDSTGTTIMVHTPTGPALTANLDQVARQLFASTEDDISEPVHEYDQTTRRMKITARTVETTLPTTDAIVPLHDPAGQPRGQLLLRNLTIHATTDTTRIQGWGGVVLLRP